MDSILLIRITSGRVMGMLSLTHFLAYTLSNLLLGRCEVEVDLYGDCHPSLLVQVSTKLRGLYSSILSLMYLGRPHWMVLYMDVMV